MSSICKRGPYQYQAIIRRKGYPSQTKTFESRQEAEAWARSVESKMDDNTFRDRRMIKEMTLKDALQRYLVEITSQKRGQVQERNRILQLQRHPLAMRSLESLQSKDFAAYREDRLEQVSPSSVRLEMAILSHLYTIAMQEWSLPLTHELENVRKPPIQTGRDRRLLNDEEERLFRAIQNQKVTGNKLWLAACVSLAIETGMRAGEILRCKWSQVDLQTGCIRLDKTKNGTKRTVPLTEEAVRVLTSLPHSGADVIPNFYDTSGLNRAFKRACQAANIEDLKFHDLRHEAATRLAPHMKVQDLAKVMGWKTLQMAMRYYNPTDGELVQMVRRARQSAKANPPIPLD